LSDHHFKLAICLWRWADLGQLTVCLAPLLSTSREDFYFGDDHSFNQTIFDETRSYWGDGPTALIGPETAAKAHRARVNTSNRKVPAFKLADTGKGNSIGESAAYLLVLGNKTTSITRKAWVEYLFGTCQLESPSAGLGVEYLLSLALLGEADIWCCAENERFPYELGWDRAQEAISLSDLGVLFGGVLMIQSLRGRMVDLVCVLLFGRYCLLLECAFLRLLH
jgi:hypothetical protein